MSIQLTEPPKDAAGQRPPERRRRFDARPAVRDARPALLLVACVAVVFFPVVLGQIVFLRDVAQWNFPARWFVRRALLAGESPLWNPWQGLGLPVATSPLYGVFYPPNWLFLLIPEAQLARALTWQSLAHLAWGGLGITFVLRGLRVPAFAALIGGLAWSLSGYTIAQWTLGVLLLANAWVPWCAWGFGALARSLANRPEGDRWAWTGGVVKAALPVAMALTLGEAFVAMMGMAFGVFFGVVVWLSSRSETAQISIDRAADAGPVDATALVSNWRAAGAGVLALVLGCGAGAVVLLPARAGLQNTVRAGGVSTADAEVASVHPLRLVEMIAPGALGVPHGDFPGARWVGEPDLGGHPLSLSLYLGAAVIALGSLSPGRDRRHRVAAALAGWTVLALLVTLGRHTPVHGWLRVVVPPLSWMRYPEKYMVLVVTPLALLAGLGAARLRDQLPRRLWIRPVIVFVTLILVAVAAPTVIPDVLGSPVRGAGISGAVAVVAVLGALWLAQRRSRLGESLLVVVVGVDLAVASVPLQRFTAAETAVLDPPAARAVRAGSRDAPAPPRVYRADSVEQALAAAAPTDDPQEQELRSLLTLVPNWATTTGLGVLPLYDAGVPDSLRLFWAHARGRASAALRVMGVGHALLDLPPIEPAARRSSYAPVLDPLPGTRLYKVLNPLPRVYVSLQAQVADDQQAMARLFDPDVVEGRLVYLAPGRQSPGLVGANESPPNGRGTCDLEAFGNDRLVARCFTPSAGVAVFLEQHAPGWQARVDDAAAVLERANVVFRAVRIPAGEHVIELRYSTPGLTAGVVVASLSLFLMAGLAAMAVWGRRRPSPGRQLSCS